MVFAVLLIVPLGLILFRLFQEDANESICRRNLKETFTAMSLYLLENDDRYPPSYARDAWSEGQLSAWSTLLEKGMNRRFSFRCPSAEDEEAVPSASAAAEKGVVPTTYGMYLPRELTESSRLSSPGLSVLIAETSDLGSRGTFDPVRMNDPNGEPLPHDGFAIGWNDGNELCTLASRFVTRLAFPNGKEGPYGKQTRGRHGDGCHALFADGHVRSIKAGEAEITRLGEEPVGLWATR
jgi:prepilin-type processing-associated H-X9-DG protein